MNIDKLNKALIEIVEKKSLLSMLSTPSPEAAQMESEILDLKHEFILEFGSFLDEALFNVHDEHCPDNEIKSLFDYMACKKLDGQYELDEEGGVHVDADDLPGVKARLVLMPNPTRMILESKAENYSEVVWVARAS